MQSRMLRWRLELAHDVEAPMQDAGTAQHYPIPRILAARLVVLASPNRDTGHKDMNYT